VANRNENPRNLKQNHRYCYSEMRWQPTSLFAVLRQSASE
jgi:hypothetical protein